MITILITVVAALIAGPPLWWLLHPASPRAGRPSPVDTEIADHEAWIRTLKGETP